MNKARRDALQDALDIVEAARDEEEEAFNNLPESLQEGAKGEAMQGAIDALGEAVDAITTAMDTSK